VRPKKTFLEVCVFLDRVLTAPQVRRSSRPSKIKVANILHIRHRDEVEAPVTDWLKDAYQLAGVPAARAVAKPSTPEPTQAKRKSKLEPPGTRPTARRPAGRSKRKTTRNR
jgi:Domain of unknown function (DUF5655)